MRKIGDWNKVRKVIGGLKHNMELAQQLTLKLFALQAESIAKKHLSNQDLNWAMLEPDYVAQKIRKGQSDKILIATSTYFQAITSYVQHDTAYAGVKRGVTNEEGKEVANIAAIHEFGSMVRVIVPRPLWKPTYEATYEWMLKNNQPVMHLRKLLNI